MTKIILAGADSAANTALASRMSALRPEWQVVSMCSGNNILQQSVDEKTDCVISDTSLVDMSGLDLMSSLQCRSPETIRLTLTLDLDKEVVLESTRANHRFINRALSDEYLVSAIESSLRLREVLDDSQLRQSISEIQNLPSLPEVYQQMVAELKAPQSSLHKIATIVETDTGLTATVLKIVNSAFYGLNKRVESVGQAVTLLGVYLIKNITLTTKVFSQFEAADIDIKRLRLLNEEASRIGAICNQFARLARAPRSVVDHTQIAGLLSNIGELVALLMPATDSPEKVDLMGAHLLRHWMMPDPVVEAIALQNEQPQGSMLTESPLVILHAIRYLEQNLPDANNTAAKQSCLVYLQDIVAPSLAEKWLEAYCDLQSLTALNETDQGRAA